MPTLILLRHGQSEWNEQNLFTGWYDCDLTKQGVEEALNGGRLLNEAGISPDVIFTSLQKNRPPPDMNCNFYPTPLRCRS